jgi:hypothetical protein
LQRKQGDADHQAWNTNGPLSEPRSGQAHDQVLGGMSNAQKMVQRIIQPDSSLLVLIGS